jgi:serine/threonine protein kinase
MCMLFRHVVEPPKRAFVIASFGPFEYPLADRYRFDSILGRGGMGIVYRATDLRLGRAVAIKILHATLTSEIGIKRFQSEIHICARLHPPNIMTVYDCGEVDGRLYFVMEYLGGESLRVRLGSEGSLPVRESIAIAEQVAAGLQYAHDNGVVHRDIKPENIILADGRACIVDFGLARVFNDAALRSLTDTGVVVGTPPYLSPEQANAEKHIGPGADQYALACVLFELLVGETPFVGRSAISIAIQHMKDTPPPLRTRRPDLAEGIGAAIERALKKRPNERFETIREFAYAVSDGSRAVPQVGNTTARTSRSKLIKAFKSYWAR